jgi:response regulator RpfG family c-di-GMP phosphodiesterase
MGRCRTNGNGVERSNMLTDAQKLEALATLGVELNRVADLDLLMERILTEARRFVNAEAGSIYIRNNEELDFTYTQNEVLQKRLPEGGKLIYSTFTMPIDKNSIAGCVAHTGQPLNIPDVYEIPKSSSFHFGREFDEASGYRTRSMLTIPLVTARKSVVGVLQIINAKDEKGNIVTFPESDERIMEHFAATATVALERAQMTRNMILRTIRMAEMRDPKETGAHVNRVGAYSVELYEAWARKKGIAEDEIDAQRDVLRMAAMLHDVGKVGISDTILKKPGRFTPEEFDIMKEHTLLGARLFNEKQSAFDDAAAEVALNHHEKWDGTGYPGHVDTATGRPLDGYIQDGRARGKRREEIPLLGRIVAITDVFDALCSKRVYKPAWSEEDALAVLAEQAGQHFDPELIELFFSNLEIMRTVRNRYPDQKETGQEIPRRASTNI